jgi:hypothetical protein
MISLAGCDLGVERIHAAGVHVHQYLAGSGAWACDILLFEWSAEGVQYDGLHDDSCCLVDGAILARPYTIKKRASWDAVSQNRE